MARMSDDPRIRYLGHSTLLIEVGGHRILTDPVLRPILGPLVRSGPAPTPDSYRDVDVVLISHLHLDHLDLASLRLLEGRQRAFIPRGSASVFKQNRIADDLVEVGPGDAHEIGDVTVRATHANHSGFRPPRGPTAPALGFLIEAAGWRIYFAGDTDLFPEMAELGRPDIALIPVGGWGLTLGKGHLDPVRAAHALRLIRPRIAVPIHWGTFWPRGLGAVRVERRSGGGALFARHAAELAPEVHVVVAQPREWVRLDEPDDRR
jgi:L-ascorbate metabolism protein UlaG (beta-lactamase superfamily)